MKSLTKTALSVYIASTMLLSGCMSTKYDTSTRKVENIISSTVRFEKQTPKSLDDLIAASNQAEATMQFTGKFNGIKERIKSNPDYNAHDDTVRLVRDIEYSGTKNRYQIAQEVKDFGYYRYDQVTKKSRFKNQGLSLTVGGGAAIGAIAIAGESMLGALGLVGIFYLMLRAEQPKTSYNKVYCVPYTGQERLIKENMKKIK